MSVRSVLAMAAMVAVTVVWWWILWALIPGDFYPHTHEEIIRSPDR